MNAYYNKQEHSISNNDIFRAYLLGDAAPVPTWKRRADTILAMLLACIAALTGSTARRIWRAFSVAILLIALIGVIGAIEVGALGLGMGFLLGSLLIGLEFLCLRRH
ncbi:MAG: hypothetical protein E7643_06195 [Ruminococcaceae bacterium]|nr:hypothetical protein [Oscillospiraceae bacterium]